MSFTTLLTHTATVYRPAVVGFDEYGNRTIADAVVYASVRCRIDERAGTETDRDADRDTVVRIATGFFDPAVELTAADRVEVAGETWQVTGMPVVRFGRVGAHHVEVSLRAVTR